MSQHYISTVINEETFTVVLGWDRPLSGYFMDIVQPYEVLDKESGETYEDEKYIYSHLEDSKLGYGSSKELNYFSEKLKEFNIDMPDEVFSIIEDDRKNNAGNLMKFYDLVDGSLHCSNDS